MANLLAPRGYSLRMCGCDLNIRRVAERNTETHITMRKHAKIQTQHKQQQTNRRTNKQASKQTNKQTSKQTNKHASNQTIKQTNKQASNQASKQQATSQFKNKNTKHESEAGTRQSGRKLASPQGAANQRSPRVFAVLGIRFCNCKIS